MIEDLEQSSETRQDNDRIRAAHENNSESHGHDGMIEGPRANSESGRNNDGIASGSNRGDREFGDSEVLSTASSGHILSNSSSDESYCDAADGSSSNEIESDSDGSEGHDGDFYNEDPYSSSDDAANPDDEDQENEVTFYRFDATYLQNAKIT